MPKIDIFAWVFGRESFTVLLNQNMLFCSIGKEGLAVGMTSVFGVPYYAHEISSWSTTRDMIR